MVKDVVNGFVIYRIQLVFLKVKVPMPDICEYL